MKIAVVTGASYGLGQSISKVLLDNRYKVYGVSRTKPTFADTNFIWIKADLLDEKELKEISKQISEDKIDVLANNAGMAFEESALGFKDESFIRMFKLNFFAPIKLAASFVTKLQKGLIINTSSISDRLVGEGDGLYSASKAALNIFFEAISFENPEIKVLSILPSYIDTPLQHTLSDNVKDFPWNENMKPVEVANCVWDLIENQSDFPSGAKVIVVNEALMEDTKDPEKLWCYNVDTNKIQKLK